MRDDKSFVRSCREACYCSEEKQSSRRENNGTVHHRTKSSLFPRIRRLKKSRDNGNRLGYVRTVDQDLLLTAIKRHRVASRCKQAQFTSTSFPSVLSHSSTIPVSNVNTNTSTLSWSTCCFADQDSIACWFPATSSSILSTNLSSLLAALLPCARSVRFKTLVVQAGQTSSLLSISFVNPREQVTLALGLAWALEAR